MAKSKQKGSNANSDKTTATPAANAPGKPTSTKEAVVTTQTATAPTREVQSAGKNASKNTKNTNANANSSAKATPAKNVHANTNTTKGANKTVKIDANTSSALSDVTATSVERARQIRKTDFERFQKFHNFFVANDAVTAGAINSNAGVKREQVDQWVRGVINPKTLASIQEIQETQPALLALLIVSVALTKYGEQELIRREGLGQMDYVVGARFDAGTLRSKQHVPHTVGVSFVLRLVLGLAPEKRAECQLLREILGHESNSRLVLTPSSKGLETSFGSTIPNADDWAKFPQNQVRQMAKQAQSDKFQEMMQQLNGEYLYDAIRAQLKQAGGASVWETKKDKPALQEKSIRPRAGSADKTILAQKAATQHAVKKSTPQVRSVKKNVPVEAEKFALVPPPAPVNIKSAANTAPTKKETAPKGKVQQAKNSTSEKNVSTVKNPEPTKNAIQTKNATPTKDATPTKNATPAKNANPAKDASQGKNTTKGKNATSAKNASASIGQNQPGAIVGGARGSRAVVGSK
ncbi:Hypothetical protein PHPALM_15211 [Phytophthora palmivora]|uniref:Uncharacterized protein n=1 Tax=Phytophthora palmivora TaxID=4796 RepID=A0A2P4XSS7_9STRA|nr:Hypothetical protein PHPALM_15211 [Phytophthora palmivora]